MSVKSVYFLKNSCLTQSSHFILQGGNDDYVNNYQLICTMIKCTCILADILGGKLEVEEKAGV